MASSAEFLGNLADVDAACASQGASDSTVVELDKQGRRLNSAYAVALVYQVLRVRRCCSGSLEVVQQ